MGKQFPLISEAPLTASHADLIPKVAADAAVLVGLKPGFDPIEAVKYVDRFVEKLQLGAATVPADEEPEVLLGCLWGEQLVREFGWHWAYVTVHDNQESKAVGVISKDCSLAIFPFDFIAGCLERNMPVTIMLSFNLLRRQSPSLPARGFANIMNHVQRIVP